MIITIGAVEPVSDQETLGRLAADPLKNVSRNPAQRDLQSSAPLVADTVRKFLELFRSQPPA